MTTNALVTKAIQAATGFADVRITSKGGCCRFYCDEDDSLDMKLTDFETIFVCYISHQTAEEWTADFINQAKETGLITEN